LGVGICHGHLDTQDSPRPGLGSKPPPYSLQYSLQLAAEATSKWHILLGLLKWSPETVPAGLSELWTAITPECGVWSQRVLNQSCSPRRGLSNDMSHYLRQCREGVDSRLLVVKSQTASLTPGPSFAHNLGCKCPNGQCEAIFDIYVSRPFQWHQEHSMRGVVSLAVELWTFGSPGRLQTSNFSKCWASPPHLAKVDLQH